MLMIDTYPSYLEQSVFEMAVLSQKRGQLVNLAGKAVENGTACGQNDGPFSRQRYFSSNN